MCACYPDDSGLDLRLRFHIIRNLENMYDWYLPTLYVRVLRIIWKSTRIVLRSRSNDRFTAVARPRTCMAQPIDGRVDGIESEVRAVAGLTHRYSEAPIL